MLPSILLGYVAGPPAANAGVPGEALCAHCHGGSSGTGSVTVTFPGGLNYSPGVTQRLIVTVTDSTQLRWGFQLTARPATSATTSGGFFTPGSDGFTRIVCISTNYAAEQSGTDCSGSAAYPLQYVEHTSRGTRPGQTGSVQFAFDWTPSAGAGGNMVVYVCANAANGDGTEDGDHIYFRSYVLGLVAGTPPVISANGVASATGLQAAISSGSWVTIQGTNLSPTTRSWGQADFVNGALPTQLDGVSVSINGKDAFVEYISPTLVNVQAPTDTHTGPVAVQITNVIGTSPPVSANMQSVSPGLFLWNARYAVATRPDYSLVGPPNLLPGETTTPAKPGDVIVLWATGLGLTTPAVPAGVATPSDRLYSAANPVSILIGDVQANVLNVVLAPGSAGLWQIGCQVPPGTPNGDLPITVQIDGIQSPAGVVIAVKQ